MPLFSNTETFETMNTDSIRPVACGKSLIACQNCANAKTGCDKMVPCSRCAEKNLRCGARYARRATKAAIRAAKSSSSAHQAMTFKSKYGGQPQQTSPILSDKSNMETLIPSPPQPLHEHPVLQANFALHGQSQSVSAGFPIDLVHLQENTSHYFGALSPFGTETSLSDPLNTPMSFLTPMSLDFSNHKQVSRTPEIQLSNLAKLDDASSLSGHVARPPPTTWSTQTNCTNSAEGDGLQSLPEVTINNVINSATSGLVNTSIWVSEREIETSQAISSLQGLEGAGMLEQLTLSTIDDTVDLDQRWRLWSQNESQNRSVYSCVATDQESSLFYDRAPILSIDDLYRPLPSPEVLWSSEDSTQWLIHIQQLQGNESGDNSQLPLNLGVAPSLNQLFKSFVRQETPQIPPGHLRPLLYPLQSIVYSLNQLLPCFHHSSPSLESRTISTMKEVQGLLYKWYALATASWATTANANETTTALILYHLLYLNTLTNFPHIERLAYRVRPGSNLTQSHQQTRSCVHAYEDVIMHCGQVCRLVRSRHIDNRPTWWVHAIYRVVLILWSDAILQSKSTFNTQANTQDSATSLHPQEVSAISMANTRVIFIDQITTNDPILKSPTWASTSTPVLTRHNGLTVGLHNPTDILEYGVRLLSQDPLSSVTDEIRAKLMDCYNRWGDCSKP